MPDKSSFFRPALLCFCLISALVVFQSGAQDSLAPQTSGDEEKIEEIEEVTAVEMPTAERPGLLQLAGRMHPALIHFPIAWLTLLLLVEALALITGKAEWSRLGLLLLALTLLSFIPAVTTGLIHSRFQGSDPDFVDLMLLHRNLNFTVVGLCLVAFVLRITRGDKLQGRARLPYFLLLAVSTGIIMFSGHLGGKMVFGENYLPF